MPLPVLPVLILLSCALAACGPERAEYGLGLSTSTIEGKVEAEGAAVPHREMLVVVYQEHYLFSSIDQEERVYRTTATLAEVRADGSYAVHMPSDVVRSELFFVAPDRLTDQFSFSRQVGIGRVAYHAVLPEHPDWRSHFYTFLQPTLSHLILEPRYKLSLAHQQRLGDWLQAQTIRLNAESAARRSAREAQDAEAQDLPESGPAVPRAEP